MNINDEKELVSSNIAKISGEIVEPATLNHELFGEKFYEMTIKSVRLSNTSDLIKVLVSDRLIDIKELIVGTYVNIEGNIRSFNKTVITEDIRKRKLIIHFFAKSIEVLSEKPTKDVNNVKLIGYVCKTPTYRKTPLGREITDLLIAVNRRNYNKSDYIPCIVWGRNSLYASDLEIGDKVILEGRIQSRLFNKINSSGESESHTAYEFSVSKINKISK